MSRKIQVSFSDRQVELLSLFKGEFGDSESEIIRGIVLAWLSEKSFITTIVKNRIQSEQENILNMESKADENN